MTCLLYGASGFIGGHIYNALRIYCDVIGTAFKHTKKGLSYTDVRYYKHVKEDLVRLKPDYLIFAAGNKNVNTSYKELYQDNVMPIKHIYKVIKKYQLKTRVIFISTDSVFAGDCGEYRDIEIPQPNTNYGKTKYLGEKALEPEPYNGIDFRIIRTSAVIGSGSVFLSWLWDNFKMCNPFKVYANNFLSPTSIELLTNSITYLIEHWEKVKQPIIHICGKRMSRYEFALMVGKVLQREDLVVPDNSLVRDSSIIPSDIQKKIKYKPMEEYLKEILC